MSSETTYLRAEAEYLACRHDSARHVLESIPDLPGPAAAVLALCRVRQVLTDWPPGNTFDAAGLPAALAEPLSQPRLESDRLFCLGWLRWLDGCFDEAEPLFAAAVQHPGQAVGDGDPSEPAYWLARVRLQLGRDDAVSAFENTLRTGRAGPRATAWLVDLLWRAGELDRAELVWKTVRLNRKVLGSDEAPLLEGRYLLRHGEFTQAQRVLDDARPRSGPLQAERALLQAWALVARGQAARAAEVLRQITSPYPPGALAVWRELLEGRNPSESVTPPPRALAALLRGLQLRLEGRDQEAIGPLREAVGVPAAGPFARYALACLGEDDFAAVLASQPGLFLALRCRARLAVDRFGQLQANPAQLLDALDRAADYTTPGTEHARRLALALACPTATPDYLRELIRQPAPDERAQQDLVQVAVELASRALLAPTALELLTGWSHLKAIHTGEPLAHFLGHHLLRLLLLTHGGRNEAVKDKALAAANRLLGPVPGPALAQTWLDGTATPVEPGTDPLAALWLAALAASGERQALATGRPVSRRLRGLAQALRAWQAAHRGDLPALVALLEEVDLWRALPGPPRFVTQAVAAVAAGQARDATLRRNVTTWLSCWDVRSLHAEARRLALSVGLLPLDPASAEPPVGVRPLPWLLHQAAREASQHKWPEALAWTRRALALAGANPEQGAAALAETARAALPDLLKLARARTLADVVRVDPQQPSVAPGLLAGMADLLAQQPEGQAALDAAAQGNLEGARALLGDLSRRPDIPVALAHPLAVTWQQAAEFLESHEVPGQAIACWRLAWLCWLRLLASWQSEDLAPQGRGGLLLEHLLGVQRRRVGELLAENRIDAARPHWTLANELPSLARVHGESLARILARAVVDFRDRLTSEHLHAMEQAMCRADVLAALAPLRAFLSLDRDNVRLLTALVDLCGQWFADCIRNKDGWQLREGVDRFTPFALKLARVVADRPEEVAARTALAEFCKFRGLVAASPDQQRALFREGLRFDPANAEVRELLDNLDTGEPA